MQVLGTTNRARGTNTGSLSGFKSGQKLLQICADISNRGKEISSRGKRDYKQGQGLQIGAGQKAGGIYQMVFALEKMKL